MSVITILRQHPLNRQNKAEQRRPDATIRNYMEYSPSPGAGPLVVDICDDPRDPQTGQPVLICAPHMPLGFVRRYPRKGLCALCVGYGGRKYRH